MSIMTDERDLRPMVFTRARWPLTRRGTRLHTVYLRGLQKPA